MTTKNIKYFKQFKTNLAFDVRFKIENLITYLIFLLYLT